MGFGSTEIIIIGLIILLLFGAKKIPDLASGVGKGIKNFKNAVKDDEEDTKTAEKVEDKPQATETKKEETTKA
jgi:sec-independent protein translocase protein TatA